MLVTTSAELLLLLLLVVVVVVAVADDASSVTDCVEIAAPVTLTTVWFSDDCDVVSIKHITQLEVAPANLVTFCLSCMAVNSDL